MFFEGKRVGITIALLNHLAMAFWPFSEEPSAPAYQVEFPVGIPDGISREFGWLKGTEWRLSEDNKAGKHLGNIVLDKSGDFQAELKICQEGGCKWSASKGALYLVTLEEGLSRFKVDRKKMPMHQNDSKLKGLILKGIRHDTNVSCGSHYSPNCAGCPKGNGESWCNGDCVWNHTEEKCASKDDGVSCGSHRAKNCVDCPQGHGSEWCHGECAWNHSAGKCVSGTRVLLQARFVRVVEAAEKDFYEILDLSEDASENDIKKQYRKLSVKYHPDKNKKKGSRELFNKIRDAYEILNDPDKKILYDIGGLDAVKALEEGKVETGAEMHVTLNVKLSDLYNGTKVYRQVNRRVVCRGCRTNPDALQCQGCNRCPDEIQMINFEVGPEMFVQQEHAVASKEKCKQENSTVEVQIEKGMQDGDTMVFPRMGDQQTGMLPGSVVFEIRTESDSNISFTRKGDDLHFKAQINLEEALIGFRRRLRHLDGHHLEFVVDGVTAPFQVLKIQGEGMPLRDDPMSFGDLYVSLEVIFPNSLTSEQRKHVMMANFVPARLDEHEELVARLNEEIRQHEIEKKALEDQIEAAKAHRISEEL